MGKVTEFLISDSVVNVFKDGVRSRVREIMRQASEEMIAEMTRKVSTELDAIAVEAANSVVVEFMKTMSISDPYIKAKLIIDVVKKQDKECERDE